MTTYRDRHLAGLYEPKKIAAKEAKDANDQKTASTKAATSKTA